MTDVMVDLDDVVFPLIDSVHAIALEQGLHDGTQPATEWEGWVQYGCTEERYWQLWQELRDRNGYVTAEPIPGALEALAAAKEAGHRIHIVTARGFFPGLEEVTRKWTHLWLASTRARFDTVTFTMDKPAAQAELGVEFGAAFDDSPKNFERLLAAGIDAYLVNHSHNDRYDDGGRRVASLADGFQRVLGVAS